MNNRIYKFRAWDKQAKRMIISSCPAGIYPSDGEITPILYFSGRFALMSDNDGGKSGLWEHDITDPDRYIVMQWTGLIDKQGEGIYEGDIVKVTCGCGHQENLPVEWKDGYNGYFAKAMRQHNWDNDQLLLTSDSEIEKIGNKWESPELLEVK